MRTYIIITGKFISIEYFLNLQVRHQEYYIPIAKYKKKKKDEEYFGINVRFFIHLATWVLVKIQQKIDLISYLLTLSFNSSIDAGLLFQFEDLKLFLSDPALALISDLVPDSNLTCF